MSIKYYDQSARDYTFRKFWNPDGDFSVNDYVKAYFRIDTPTYDMTGRGKIWTDEEKTSWKNEIDECFKSLGWNDPAHSVSRLSEYTCGKQHLYMHPADISGTVRKSEVRRIAEALENHKTFSLRYVDVYEDVFDLTDDEYRAMLEENREYTKAVLVNCCKTARRTLFHRADQVIDEIGYRIAVPRIGLTDYPGRSSSDENELAYAFVADVIRELAEIGYLVSVVSGDNTHYIRTPNKSEQKTAKIDLEKFVSDTLGGTAA